MEQVEEYGIEAVLADKAKFIEFRIDQFLKHFSKENISGEEEKILSLLASYSPLPLTVVASTLFSSDMSKASRCMTRLIDLSFVVLENRFYRISDPIEDAAIKAFGLPENKVIKSLTTSIYKLIKDPSYEEQRLDLHRILFRVSWLIKDKKLQQEVIFLFNDLIKTIKSLYNNAESSKSYERVIEVTEVALNECKSKSDYDIVHTFRAKSFIHLQEWEKAKSEIELLKEYTPLRNVYYLEGFLNRKRGKNEEAIASYLESKKCGRNDESLNRELGQCYFYIGDYPKADDCVKKVLQKEQEKKRVNFFTLDLQARIAIACNNENVARKSIEQLQDIDEAAYYGCIPPL
jgi:tetratricopeptide (TPR) repeat protein